VQTRAESSLLELCRVQPAINLLNLSLIFQGVESVGEIIVLGAHLGDVRLLRFALFLRGASRRYAPTMVCLAYCPVLFFIPLPFQRPNIWGFFWFSAENIWGFFWFLAENIWGFF
jgi:hypothetical protein